MSTISPLPRSRGLVAVLLLGACGSSTSGPSIPPGTCTGVAPPSPAWSAAAGPLRGDAGALSIPDGGCAGPNCVGAQLPLWALYDFQPKSCGYKATYGPDVFAGKAVLLALWAGW